MCEKRLIGALFALFGATVFTVLISGGVAHATNLIDGLNGLAMGVCMLIASGLAFLAQAVGDTVILNISILLMCSISHLEKSSLGMQGHTPWGMY